MRRNKGRIKKWMLYNKAATIWISIILVYTLLMISVIFIFKNDKGCSSGSLSSLEVTTEAGTAQNSTMETTPENASETTQGNTTETTQGNTAEAN